MLNPWFWIAILTVLTVSVVGLAWLLTIRPGRIEAVLEGTYAGKNWLTPSAGTPSLWPASDVAAPECWPGRVEPLPEGTHHAEFRCFTCGAHHNNIPTASVGEDMATRHLAEYPDHDVRAWLYIVEEIKIKRVKP